MPTVQLAIEEAFSKALGLLPVDHTLVGARGARSTTLRREGESEDAEEEPGRNTSSLAIGPHFGHVTSVVVTGASRTDAGVHARRQVFHVDLPSTEPFNTPNNGEEDKLLTRTNTFFHDEILIKSLIKLHPPSSRFDCSRASIGKRYTYSMYDGAEPLSLAQLGKERAFVFDLYNDSMRLYCMEKVVMLNVKEMHRACQFFIGTHDFRRFTRSAKRCAKQVDSKGRTVRTIYAASVWRDASGIIRFQVEGNGFLYLMVRCMACAVMNVGRGKLSAVDIQSALQMSHDRTEEINVFIPMQPSGLSLDEVYYDAASFDGATIPRWISARADGDNA